jgi:DNA-binding IclR family transcriptional regulator
MEITRRDGAGVQVLHKALDILEAIRDSRDELGLAGLARAVQLPKPTVYRILTTLESRSYLHRTAGGTYRLARKVAAMRSPSAFDQTLSQAAGPVMDRLAEVSRETVNLGLLDAGEVMVIHTVESPQTVRMASKIGNRRHAHSTGLGKVLLAAMGEKTVLRLIRLKGLPRLTPNTIASPAGLLAELRQVRLQGFAFDNRENEMDGCCVAASIAGPGGCAVAALSVSGPVFRMDVARARTVLEPLHAACAAIGRLILPEK